MRKEFEEQSKKGILGNGQNTPNPLQNFDMAAWMAGKSSGAAAEEVQSKEVKGEGSGGKARRRG